MSASPYGLSSNWRTRTTPLEAHAVLRQMAQRSWLKQWEGETSSLMVGVDGARGVQYSSTVWTDVQLPL
jgi:hypothetical protein